MAKAKFHKDSNDGVANLSTLTGGIRGDGSLLGFDSSGYLRFYLDDKTPAAEIEECLNHIAKAIGVKRALVTPDDGVLSIDIIDDVYRNPKSGNLIISSIAPDKVLLILKDDEYTEIDDLVDAVQNALIDLSNDKNATVDWQAHAV